jgi:phage terminase small subunit
LKLIDKSELAAWVVASFWHRKAVAEVERLGMLVQSPNVGAAIQNPYMAIANRQAAEMRKWVCELGFTP